MVLPMFPETREKMIIWNLDKTYLLSTQEQMDTFCHKPNRFLKKPTNMGKMPLLQHILKGRDDFTLSMDF